MCIRDSEWTVQHVIEAVVNHMHRTAVDIEYDIISQEIKFMYHSKIHQSINSITNRRHGSRPLGAPTPYAAEYCCIIFVFHIFGLQLCRTFCKPTGRTSGIRRIRLFWHFHAEPRR